MEQKLLYVVEMYHSFIKRVIDRLNLNITLDPELEYDPGYVFSSGNSIYDIKIYYGESYYKVIPKNDNVDNWCFNDPNYLKLYYASNLIDPSISNEPVLKSEYFNELYSNMNNIMKLSDEEFELLLRLN